VTEAHLPDFNAVAPGYGLSSGIVDGDDPYQSRGGQTLGDELRQEYDLLRARMIDRALWPTRVQGFAQAWEDWKQQLGVLDFADMIDHAREGGGPAPGNPNVILVDECQDHSRAELELLRTWARYADQLVLVGDPWQSLYTWRGSYPEMFASPRVGLESRSVLSQSYRVPRAVHRAALRWIGQLSTYEPIRYEPRDEDGLTTEMPTTRLAPESIIDQAEQCVADGQTVMICATAGYMLSPTLRVLRDRGVPFSNPWGAKKGQWNPLRVTRGVSTAERILALLRSLVRERHERGEGGISFNFGWNDSDGDVKSTIAALFQTCDAYKFLALTTGVLRKGARDELARCAAGDSALSHQPFTDEHVDRWIKPDQAPIVHRLINGELSADVALRWWEDHLQAGRRQGAQYPLRVVQTHGTVALAELPRLYIGTVHSFKGAEADVVFIYPDLSPAAMREWLSHGTNRDVVLRVFYVALTRARRAVYVCRPSSGMSVNVGEYVN